MESDSDSGFAVDGAGGAPSPAPGIRAAAPHGARRGRPRGSVASRAAHVCVLIANAAGYGAAGPFGDCRVDIPAGTCIVGLVLLAAFELVRPQAQLPECPHHAALRQLATRTCNSSRVMGLVEYPIQEVRELVEPLHMGEASVGSIMRHIGALQATGPHLAGEQRATVASIIAGWRRGGARGQVLRLQMCPRLAQLVLRHKCAVLHVTAFGQRLARKLLLVQSEPSAACVKAWLQEREELAADVAETVPAKILRATGQNAALTLSWIEASARIKDTKKSYLAARSFAKLFARAGKFEYVELLEGLKVIHQEALRWGRCRLDLSSMLLSRALMHQMVSGLTGTRVGLYLYTDASPQLRGTELCCSSIDTVCIDNDFHSRKLLPVVSLQRCMFSSRGKVFALLWQLFLFAGPTFAAMRGVCRRIRGVVTDLGAERKVADYRDVLPEFMALIGHPASPSDTLNLQTTTHLFPLAVALPGWRHAVDILLQRSLCSQSWFPRFLARLKVGASGSSAL